jgi:hypothetical protein
MIKQTSTWIFQANPKISRIFESLQNEDCELWSCRQHSKKIKAGDRALIWISGKKPGIYAVGKILTDPSLQPDTPTGLKYWTNPFDGIATEERVWVEYERRMLDKPLLKEYIRCDPQLWELKILRAPFGTNFLVEHEEWEAIESWLNP